MLAEAYRKFLADKSRARNVKYKQQHHTQTQYFKVSWQKFENPTLFFFVVVGSVDLMLL